MSATEPMTGEQQLSEYNLGLKVDKLQRQVNKQWAWRLQVLAGTETRLRKARQELTDLGFEAAEPEFPKLDGMTDEQLAELEVGMHDIPIA